MLLSLLLFVVGGSSCVVVVVDVVVFVAVVIVVVAVAIIYLLAVVCGSSCRLTYRKTVRVFCNPVSVMLFWYLLVDRAEFGVAACLSLACFPALLLMSYLKPVSDLRQT